MAYRTTAARVHGIPLPAWAKRAIPGSNSLPGSGRLASAARSGVRRVMLPDADVVDLDGIRVTTPQRTFADLASLLSLADTVAAGDHLVCAHGPGHPGEREAMMGLEELRRYVAGIKGRHGVVRAREAAGLVRVGADSPPETKLRLALADAGLPEPMLGLVVCDGFGRPVLFPDLAFPDYRVAVQYDGGHHLASAQAASDARRESRTLVLGWKSVVGDTGRRRGRGLCPGGPQGSAGTARRGWDPSGSGSVWRGSRSGGRQTGRGAGRRRSCRAAGRALFSDAMRNRRIHLPIETRKSLKNAASSKSGNTCT